ncbi:MAG: hypothetical protein IJG45_02300 [Oscillospiraceae bacterium]|nr:hypothetical protein [Oscillospiraceae bacterium]
MKRTIAILLALVMLLSLAACGGDTTTSKPQSTDAPVAAAPSTEAPTKAPTEATATAEEVTIGSSISLNFVEMTLDAFEISEGYNFEYTDNSSGITITQKSSIDCPSGMKLVCLKGSFTNKAKHEIYPGNNPADGVMIINGNEYNIRFKCYNSAEAESIMNIVAQQTVDYYFYAEVPNAVADAIESCEVYIGFIEEMDPSVWVMDMSDYDYLYKLDAIPSK